MATTIQWILREGHNQDNILNFGCSVRDDLNARAEAAIAVGAYRFAMQNAIEMISTKPTDALGYIRESKIYEVLLQYARAMAVYKEGLDLGDRSARFYMMNFK
ncbi:hypothetical protein V1515DRAFT_628976 [Lipomyces mesembrius]